MTILGLDYGTTYSTLSVSSDTSTLLLKHCGTEYIPSVIAIHDTTGKILVGSAAQKLVRKVSEYSVYLDMKRWLGVTSFDVEGRKRQLSPTYRIYTTTSIYETSLGPCNKDGKLVPIAELIAKYIMVLVKTMEERCNIICSGLVISVPSQYNTRQRAFMTYLAGLMDIPVKHIMNEPSAALFAAVCNTREKSSREIYAVYDFGGGTFDVSVVLRRDNYYSVVLSGGDDALGGRDIDRALKTNLDLTYSVDVNDDIVASLKENVSKTKTNQSIVINGVTVILEYKVLRRIVRPFLDRAAEVLRKVVLSSGIHDDFTLVPIGGSAELPGVVASVKGICNSINSVNLFPRSRSAVSEGCSLISASIGLEGYLFVDCITSTISGIDGFFCVDPLIPVGSPLPCEAQISQSTTDNYNVMYQMSFFEGDDNRQYRNFMLTSFTVAPETLGTTVRRRWSFKVVVAVSPLGLLRITMTNSENDITRDYSLHTPQARRLRISWDMEDVATVAVSNLMLQDYDFSQQIEKPLIDDESTSLMSYIQFLRQFRQRTKFYDVKYHELSVLSGVSKETWMEVRRSVPLFLRDDGYSVYTR